MPEVLRPLYESSSMLAQKMTLAALRFLKQIAAEASHPVSASWGRQPAALRSLSHRLYRGFNEALNGFPDEGWSTLGSDGNDDVTIAVNSSNKVAGMNIGFTNGATTVISSVLCAKASMLIQNVSPAILLRFLREHRSEWADSGMDMYFNATGKAIPCSFPCSRGGFGGQVILPLAHTVEHEEFLEILKLEDADQSLDTFAHRDLFFLQVSRTLS